MKKFMIKTAVLSVVASAGLVLLLNFTNGLMFLGLGILVFSFSALIYVLFRG